VHTIAPDGQSQAKREYALQLQRETLACIGNGRNDALVMKECALAIAVIGPEGAAFPAIAAAHVVTASITDALDLLLNPRRLLATLRE
jgi:soluble P-type ATPase